MYYSIICYNVVCDMYKSLLVVHRVCPSLSKTAVGFASKLEMVQETSASLVKALAKLGAKVRLVVVLDGCDDAYVRLFEDVCASEGRELVDLSVERTNAIGNAATWNRQVEIALERGIDAEYVFFSEDDYLFREDAVVVMLDFMDRGLGDFVSPLDHPDRYLTDSRREKTNIVASRYCHWRALESSCMTFLMRRSLLPKILRQSSVYQFNCSDGAFWQTLTQWRMRSPLTWLRAAWSLFRWTVDHRYSSRYLTFVHILRRLGLRAFFFPRYTLWSPIPTLAVHLSDLSLPLCAETFHEECEDELREKALRYLGLQDGFVLA